MSSQNKKFLPKKHAIEKPVVADYMYLVTAISIKFKNTKEEVKDSEIFSVLCHELLLCIGKYNSNLGPFNKYASNHLFNKAIQHLRYIKRKKRFSKNTVSMETLSAYGVPDIEDKSHKNQENTPPHLSDCTLLSKLLEDNCCDTKQNIKDKKILKDFYIKGKTIAFLAKKNKKTRMALYDKMRRAIKLIRQKNVGLIGSYATEN